MKTLLIHSEDDPENGPWADSHWDRIVDLGLGGKNVYARWKRRWGCRVDALRFLSQGFSDFHRIRDVLGAGCGRLVDEHGLDWWEIMSVYSAEELEALILLQRFAESMSSNKEEEVYVSRPCLHASLLQDLICTAVHVFPLRRKAKKRFRHYIRAISRLSAVQINDVFWDKFDAGYQFRGRFSRRRRPSAHPVVLLPSAYVNVSRTGVAYANTLPQQKFLLIAARKSGWIESLPSNVAAGWLSSYAALRDRRDETADMEARWRSLLNELSDLPELETLKRLGYSDGFLRRFRQGIEVRDAWLNVLDTEPVQAVLCADDSNPCTRIPLLLARERGLPNMACHHGALDGQTVYKRSYADVILAKGRMEKDYLVRCCRVPAENVEIGAPALAAGADAREQRDGQAFHPDILFISEAFEANGGRAEEFYRDVLPALAELALNTGRKLIVKLHPIESKSERAGMLSRVFSPRQKSVTQIVEGRLSEDLFARAWFGITALSTVATECAIRGIPCFLCRWLDFGSHGYVDQFVRFGVGIDLSDPSEIARIPDYLEQHAANPDALGNCWQVATQQRLAELLTSSPKRLARIAAAG
jgi:hypothetical protein